MDYYSEGEESQEYFTPSEYYVLSQESFVSAESSFSSEAEHSSQDSLLTSETDSSSQESCSSSETETLTQQSSELDQSTQSTCTSSESDHSTQKSCTYSETDQQTQESHSSSRNDGQSQESLVILGRVQDTQESLATSEITSSQDYFDDLELYSDSESNVENSFIAPARVYSSFLMRRPCDFISMKAPAPEGDYLWEVSLFPFHQVSYVNRNDRWRYAQVIFSHTLNRSDELFLDVVYVMDETYKYVSEHPNCQSGPYNRKYDHKIQSKSILDEWDCSSNNHFGVNSNYFWRKDNGCIWLRAPAPKEELFLEMALYNFDSVAGVRKEERWRFAKLNLSHSISTSGIIYNKLIPVVKTIYGLIMSHPNKIVNECQNIEGILL